MGKTFCWTYASYKALHTGSSTFGSKGDLPPPPPKPAPGASCVMQQDFFGLGLRRREVPIGSRELCEITLPYYGYAIDCFGAQRCMFESNFPPDKEGCSYRVLYNAFKRVAAAKNLTAAQKKEIFHDTAVRVYRLDDHFGAAKL